MLCCSSIRENVEYRTNQRLVHFNVTATLQNLVPGFCSKMTHNFYHACDSSEKISQFNEGTARLRRKMKDKTCNKKRTFEIANNISIIVWEII